MAKWSFPSRGNGTTEGLSNPGLEWFKDDPLKALAREICQNSLDAVDDNDKPVRVVFKDEWINTCDFPGMDELLSIVKKCDDFWKDYKNEKTDVFIKNATRILQNDKMHVLRISDFNTTGLTGAFVDGFTNWNGLVKSIGVNLKNSDSAAGSFGIGKAAAYINSDIQTVFYRTRDKSGETAAQGVANLMSFKDESYGDEDPVRRSVGYYGNPNKNMPLKSMDELDRIYQRSDSDIGTDIFIPGFHIEKKEKTFWIDTMIGEILENFLVSIYNEKLVVQIHNQIIDKNNLNQLVENYKKIAPDAYCFNKALANIKDDVVSYDFNNMGELKLRLLYEPDMNQKILVVRESGMKIVDIRGLPKGISYTGILELEGKKLNGFFRKIENPQHTKWEPQRYTDDPALAKKYKKELEDWVKKNINSKLEEKSGDESIINIGDCFNTFEGDEKEQNEKELTDTEHNVMIVTKSVKNNHSVNNLAEKSGNDKARGIITDDGDLYGHRHRSGIKGNLPTGRMGVKDDSGSDVVYTGKREINVLTRIIKRQGENNRIIITAGRDIKCVEVEILAIGENGKKVPIQVDSVLNKDVYIKNGKIIIDELIGGTKKIIDFTVDEIQNCAMGVKIYGD